MNNPPTRPDEQSHLRNDVEMLAKRFVHLRRHWHHHLSIWGILLCLALLLVAATAVTVIGRGGYKRGPLPPPIRIAGAPLPPEWWLGRFVTRIHNQGYSNSCVGQTLATMEEIAQHERAPKSWTHFSAGYIWNQLNGGQDQPVTYEAAFSLLYRQGDARLRIFPPDGVTQQFVQPGPAARADAGHYRIHAWRSIVASDTYTMRAELHAGHPLAVAIPVTDSFYTLWNDGHIPVVAAQSGAVHFWHSVTAIGYTPQGIVILNSWGPHFGFQGRALLTWRFLQLTGAAIVVSA